jgi:hypothetical protein
MNEFLTTVLDPSNPVSTVGIIAAIVLIAKKLSQ